MKEEENDYRENKSVKRRMFEIYCSNIAKWKVYLLNIDWVHYTF